MRGLALIAPLIALLPLLLAACATAGAPVRVTRFHLNMPIVHGAVAVEEAQVPGAPALASPRIASPSLETQRYLSAVQAELQRQGFAAPTDPASAPLLAAVSLSRTSRDIESARRPLTIGIGGGGFGGGVGGGASAAFGVGKRPVRTFYLTQLSVQLRDRAGGSIIWEGRAQTEVNANSADAQPAAEADKLARALFRGFPGESGRTITVK